MKIFKLSLSLLFALFIFNQIFLPESISGENKNGKNISLIEESPPGDKYFEMNIFGGLPMIEIKRTNLDGWGKVIKRILDIIGSLIGLIIFSPLFLVITFSIKWETQGPVFARLKRISGKKEFILLKFRSMIENAEELKPLLVSFNERDDGPLFKMKYETFFNPLQPMQLLQLRIENE